MPLWKESTNLWEFKYSKAQVLSRQRFYANPILSRNHHIIILLVGPEVNNSSHSHQRNQSKYPMKNMDNDSMNKLESDNIILC